MKRFISFCLSLIMVLSILMVFRTDTAASDDEKAYWKSYSNDYYYWRLNEQDRAVYDCIDKGLEEFLLSDEEDDEVCFDLREFNIVSTPEIRHRIGMIYHVVSQNNPQYFYVGINLRLTDYQVDDVSYCDFLYIDVYPDFQKGEDRARAREDVSSILESYVKEVPSDALPEEKEKIIYDLIYERVTYAEYVLPSGIVSTQSMYSAVKGKTVCIGYAMLFAALMNKVGVQCVVNGSSCHAWNMINLHGYWYCVDTTDAGCFDTIPYHCYNQRYGLLIPDGLYEEICPIVDIAYDNLEETTGHTSRYIRQGSQTFFIVNDLDDYYGRLALCITSDTTSVKTVCYNGKRYNVINFAASDTGSFVPTVEKKDFSDFVERLYVNSLGRASEPDGKAFWCGKVESGEMTGSDCARGFLYSKEFLDKKLDDKAFLTVLYKTFFDRNAEDDPEGFKYWMGQIGSIGRSRVIEGFINSEEWCDLCVSYGVKAGAEYARAGAATSDSVAFATRLYTECLGREPETDGLKFWSIGISSLEIKGSYAAHEFFYSREFVELNLEDGEYVRRLYRTFMGRDPEKEGFEHWVNELKNGKSRDDVFNFFANCEEFTKICEDYSIER